MFFDFSNAIFIIILIFTIIGAIRGFANTILNIIGSAVALVTSYFLSNIISKVIFEKVLRNYILYKIDQLQPNGALTFHSDTILYSLPNWATGMIKVFADMFRLNSDEIINLFSNIKISEVASENIFIDDVIKPIIISILSFFISIIIFTILIVIVKKLCKIISKVFELPVLKSINHTLGGIFGALEGIIIVTIVSNVLKILSLL